METRRCVYCHKLQRVGMQECIRCGQPFRPGNPLSSITDITSPSLPSASPHRAGHYFGLHPEDQPYQSNKILTAHFRDDDDDDDHILYGRGLQLEPERITFPATDQTPALKRYREALYNAPARQEYVPAYEEGRVKLPVTSHVTFTRRLFRFSHRTVSLALGVSCFLFLLASSIMALGYINASQTGEQAALEITPYELRANDLFSLKGQKWAPRVFINFTFETGVNIMGEDTQPLRVLTDDQGGFQVSTRVVSEWSVGQHFITAIDAQHKRTRSANIYIQVTPPDPPYLYLDTETLDLKTTTLEHALELENRGGGTVEWQASSNQSWLTISPDQGSFSGRQEVKLKVNRQGLAAQQYSGQLQFVQPGALPLTLTVMMEVKSGDEQIDDVPTPAPGELTLSVSTLAFTTAEGRSVDPQALQIQNTGGQAFDWTVTAATNDRGGWLTATPASGSLEGGSQFTLNVTPSTQRLLEGTYQGTLTFRAGEKTSLVTVWLTVVDKDAGAEPTPTSEPHQPPYNSPGIKVEPATLQLDVSEDTEGSTQLEITLTNTGTGALKWQSTVDGYTQSYVKLMPKNGHLEPGQSRKITINVDVSRADAGELFSTITLWSADPRWPMHKVVRLHINILDDKVETLPAHD